MLELTLRSAASAASPATAAPGGLPLLIFGLLFCGLFSVSSAAAPSTATTATPATTPTSPGIRLRLGCDRHELVFFFRVVVYCIDLVLNRVFRRRMLDDAPFIDLDVQESFGDLRVGVHDGEGDSDLKKRDLAVAGEQLEAAVLVADDCLRDGDHRTIELLLFCLHLD